jgi:hypothetical protein
MQQQTVPIEFHNSILTTAPPQKEPQDHLRAWGLRSLLPHSGFLSRAAGCWGWGRPADLMSNS